MPLYYKNKQIRHVTIGKGGRVTKYKVWKGDLWASGYDERAQDNLDNLKLKPGIYVVSFYPLGEAKGWDSITHFKCQPIVK